jgi:hypothetical protein
VSPESLASRAQGTMLETHRNTHTDTHTQAHMYTKTHPYKVRNRATHPHYTLSPNT